MTKTIGLYDIDTGERGWVRYETKKKGPIEFMLWFDSKSIEGRIRTYLATPFEMAVQVRKPRSHALDDGISWLDVKPTDNTDTFETALRQMYAEIRVGMEEPA
jgi:hypothetical protein